MAKDVGNITVQILRQIRDELQGLNGRVDGLNGRVDDLNGRVDALTEETRSGFAKMRQEFHTEVVGERRLVRLESKK